MVVVVVVVVISVIVVSAILPLTDVHVDVAAVVSVTKTVDIVVAFGIVVVAKGTE